MVPAQRPLESGINHCWSGCGTSPLPHSTPHHLQTKLPPASPWPGQKPCPTSQELGKG